MGPRVTCPITWVFFSALHDVHVKESDTLFTRGSVNQERERLKTTLPTGVREAFPAKQQQINTQPPSLLFTGEVLDLTSSGYGQKMCPRIGLAPPHWLLW